MWSFKPLEVPKKKAITENPRFTFQRTRALLWILGGSHCGFQWKELTQCLLWDGDCSCENLACHLNWGYASEWAGTGKAVSGSQLISQSKNIYRILYVRGSRQGSAGDTRRIKGGTSAHEGLRLISLGGKVFSASRKHRTRHYFNWAGRLRDTENVTQTNRLLFWAYHHLPCTLGCRFSKQLWMLLFITGQTK